MAKNNLMVSFFESLLVRLLNSLVVYRDFIAGICDYNHPPKRKFMFLYDFNSKMNL